jgi:hypothetical protein
MHVRWCVSRLVDRLPNEALYQELRDATAIIAGLCESSSDLAHLHSIQSNPEIQLTWRDGLIANVLYCHPTTINTHLSQRLRSCESLIDSIPDERLVFDSILLNTIRLETDHVCAWLSALRCVFILQLY